MFPNVIADYAFLILSLYSELILGYDLNTTFPIVKLQQGLLRGKAMKTLEGVPYYSFIGISFGEPPIGKLRFKDPIPASSWEGIKDAIEESNLPAQFHFNTYQFIGSDDCLYLNVHTPKLEYDGELLPVMVKIFGGAFVSGNITSTHFKPNNFINENVVFVNINFRIGVMGFLCTDPVNARGDMGLKDQTMALKWIKDNIQVFNGDPNKITIFGCSSGSASVDYHILSPKSKGLFQRAIMQSGSVMNFWSRSNDGVEYARRLAAILGYNKNSNETLFNFLNNFDTKTLVLNSRYMMNADDFRLIRLYAFPPVINQFKGYDGFLNEEPHTMLKRGDFNKVEILSGVTNYEGYDMSTRYESENQEIEHDLLNGNFIKLIPKILNIGFKDCDKMLRCLYRYTKTNDCESKFSKPTNIVNFFTDLLVHAGVFFSLEQRLKYNLNNEYFYYFTYNINMDKYPTIRGANHASEEVLIGLTRDPKYFTPTDVITKDRLMKMWTNFAKTGNPTPEQNDLINVKWLPMTKNKFQFLNISVNLNMSYELHTERRNLWRKIYESVKM